MNEFIQVFIDFIPNDKEFVEALMPQYEDEFQTLGGFIRQHSTILWCKDTPEMQELFDFLDGNGFEVSRPEWPIPNDTHPVKLVPIYPPKINTIDEEIRLINEKLKETIERIESAVSQYVPVQETVLSYTSMEDNKRYILEYEKLLASWTFWLCVCRRVELLQLVSEGRCGSTPVPRPP